MGAASSSCFWWEVAGPLRRVEAAVPPWRNASPSPLLETQLSLLRAPPPLVTPPLISYLLAAVRTLQQSAPQAFFFRGSPEQPLGPPLTSSSSLLSRPSMQLRHVRTVLPATDGPIKVTAIAWSPNSTRLAVATYDRVISLFDEHGEQRKDKFSTKPVSLMRVLQGCCCLERTPACLHSLSCACL